MHHSLSRRGLAAAAVLVPALSACSPDHPTAAAPAPSLAQASTTPGGAMFVMSDGSVRNVVHAFRRGDDGSLAPLGEFPTGGAGTPAGARVAPSSSPIVLGADNRFLFVANAGSDDVSSFVVAPDGRLAPIARVPSGGDMPVSLAVHGRLLYVLNAGDGTLRGLRVDDAGRPSPLPGSTHAVGYAGGTDGAVRFTPDGNRLVVALKGGIDFDPDGRFLLVTHKVSDGPGPIVVFPVLADGRLGAPTRAPAPGIGGSGDDVLIGGEGGVLSVWRNVNGAYTWVASRPTGGTGACCVLAGGGPRVYVLNGRADGLPGGGVAGFALGDAGELTPLAPDGLVAALPAGAAPVALGRSPSGGHVFTLTRHFDADASGGAVVRFAVRGDGTLVMQVRTTVGGAGRPRALAMY